MAESGSALRPVGDIVTSTIALVPKLAAFAVGFVERVASAVVALLGKVGDALERLDTYLDDAFGA